MSVSTRRWHKMGNWQYGTYRCDTDGQIMIHNTDILDQLLSIETGSVDFAFSDPPYNAHKDYGVYKDNRSEKEYHDWCREWVEQYKRVSNNRIALFLSSKRLKEFWDLIPDAKLIIVRKGAISTPFKTYYNQYYGLLVTVKPRRQIYDLWDSFKLPGEGYYFREERYPHPGLTSLKLTQFILSEYTKPNALVFDGFMGTGTTAVASLSLGRRYLGCELNPEYIQIAKERIKRVKMQLPLFSPEQLEII